MRRHNESTWTGACRSRWHDARGNWTFYLADTARRALGQSTLARALITPKFTLPDASVRRCKDISCIYDETPMSQKNFGQYCINPMGANCSSRYEYKT